jgi:hypothetical protein
MMLNNPKKISKRKNSRRPGKDGECEKLDQFQRLTNGCPTGPIAQIQISREMITSVHGVMFDIDPDKFDARKYPAVLDGPEVFYEEVLSKWLDNNDVLRKSEVRMSGSGLHVLLWLKPPVEIGTPADQEHWDGVITAIQACLPIDPGQPSITGCTREIGSVNGKNGKVVKQLAAGEPVTQDEIEGLYRRMMDESFKTVCTILYGSDKVPTCPICQTEGTSLQAFKNKGTCYKCKAVSLEQLYNSVYATNSSGGEKNDSK